MNVTESEKKAARKTDLYEFLINHYPGEVIKDGNSLRLRSNKSISIKKGYAGYKDFADFNNHGNGIDFLVKYMGFGFCEAVKAVNDGLAAACVDPEKVQKKYFVPQKAENNNRIRNYLAVERAISRWLIDWLISKNVLYQDTYSNAVFISRNRDFWECRGIFDSPYHRNMDSSPTNNGYWYFQNPDAKALTKAFICESAIDAISLCLLNPDDGFYFSIAGCGNQQRIDAIKALGLQTFTAFDNDDAGQDARNRNNDIKHIIPKAKDWNEQLKQLRKVV